MVPVVPVPVMVLVVVLVGVLLGMLRLLAIGCCRLPVEGQGAEALCRRLPLQRQDVQRADAGLARQAMKQRVLTLAACLVAHAAGRGTAPSHNKPPPPPANCMLLPNHALPPPHLRQLQRLIVVVEMASGCIPGLLPGAVKRYPPLRGSRRLPGQLLHRQLLPPLLLLRLLLLLPLGSWAGAILLQRRVSCDPWAGSSIGPLDRCCLLRCSQRLLCRRLFHCCLVRQHIERLILVMLVAPIQLQ